MWFSSLNEQLGTLVWLVLLLPVLVWGGRWERRLAWLLLVDLAFVELLPLRGRHVHDIQWPQLIGDVAVFGVLLWRLFNVRQGWVPVATGFQLVAVLAHLPRLLDAHVRNYGYMTVTTATGYAVVLTLAVGTYLERRHAR